MVSRVGSRVETHFDISKCGGVDVVFGELSGAYGFCWHLGFVSSQCNNFLLNKEKFICVCFDFVMGCVLIVGFFWQVEG